MIYCSKPASWHHLFVKPNSNQSLRGQCWFEYISIYGPNKNGRANCRRQEEEHVDHPFINLRVYGEKRRRVDCTKILSYF